MAGAAQAATPAQLAGHGLLSMLRAGLETAHQRRAWPGIASLMLLAWLGFTGVSGVHLGGAWRAPVLGVPRPVLFAAASLILAITALVLRRRRALGGGHPGLALLAAVLAAYLLGNLISGGLHRLLAPASLFASSWAGFIASRLLYTSAVAAPMLILLWLGRQPLRPFSPAGGLSAWSRRTRLGRNDRPRSWTRTLGFFAVAVVLPLFILLQAGNGFTLLPRLPALLLPLLLMALSNAVAEELLFRGLIQSAAVRAGGMAFGIWAVAMLFGLHHWGASFAAVGSLPVSLLIGAGSALFGRSVVETGSLAWAVCAHALVDLALFSRYYVGA